MSKRPVLLGVFSALLLGACATLPNGPSVMVLPGAQKTFEQFREDDALCQFYARQAVGGQTPTQTAMDSGTTSAVAGTAIGAAAGALIGAAAGEPAGGAAIGAGSGLLLGSATGTGAYERLWLRPAEPLRHHLRTMHVRQGEPGAGLRSISGCIFALSAPAAATEQRGSAACSTRCKTAASPTRRTATAQQSVKRISGSASAGFLVTGWYEPRGRRPVHGPESRSGPEDKTATVHSSSRSLLPQLSLVARMRILGSSRDINSSSCASGGECP